MDVVDVIVSAVAVSLGLTLVLDICCVVVCSLIVVISSAVAVVEEVVVILDVTVVDVAVVSFVLIVDVALGAGLILVATGCEVVCSVLVICSDIVEVVVLSVDVAADDVDCGFENENETFITC